MLYDVLAARGTATKGAIVIYNMLKKTIENFLPIFSKIFSISPNLETSITPIIGISTADSENPSILK